MKKTTNKLLMALMFLVVIFGVFENINAQNVQEPTEYTLLTPLPGIGDDNNQTTLQDYLPQVFNLTIGIAAALAFIMLTFGGVTYAVSDSITGKNDGKKWIENALWGLLLVIGAYTILYTINPQILKFDLSITRPNIESTEDIEAVATGSGKILPGYKLSNEQVRLNNEMRTDLRDNYGVNVNSGPCVNGETQGCTNLVGMHGRAYVGVTKLKENCACNVTITGGTEGGHQTHGPNLTTLDLSKDPRLNAFVLANDFGPILKTTKGLVYSVRIGSGLTAVFLDEGNHWHVKF